MYGHDNDAKTQLEVMLRRWKLDPLILDQLPSEGATIIEKLEKYTSKVGFAVVLATPDDEGHRVAHSDEKVYRARQNVVLELGMLLARLGRSRVAILLKDPGQMERPSDIQGLIYISFKQNLQTEGWSQLLPRKWRQPVTTSTSRTYKEPNKGLELTASSVRSYLAPASGSSSGIALDAKGTKTKTAGQSQI